jgi:hypothetical protein
MKPRWALAGLVLLVLVGLFFMPSLPAWVPCIEAIGSGITFSITPGTNRGRNGTECERAKALCRISLLFMEVRLYASPDYETLHIVRIARIRRGPNRLQ